MNEPVDLTPTECLELLAAGSIGRIALATPVGPRIIPVNYLLRDGALVFRTTPYSELGSYGPGNEVAFEIDHFDHASHQGWSVVALGRLQRVAASEELDDLRRNRGPEPWAGGHRGLYLTLEWREVSGRRIGSDWVHLMRPAI